MHLRQAAFGSFCIECSYFRKRSSRIFWSGCCVVRHEILRWRRFRSRLRALKFYVYFLVFSSDIEVLLGTKLLCDKRHRLPIGIESCFYKPLLQYISGSYGKPCSELHGALYCGLMWTFTYILSHYADFDVHSRLYISYTITISYRPTFCSL
jgi:hypothetical protein